MSLERILLFIAVVLFGWYALQDTSLLSAWHPQFVLGAGLASFAGSFL